MSREIGKVTKIIERQKLKRDNLSDILLVRNIDN